MAYLVEISEILRNLGLVAAAAVGLWVAWLRSRAATRQADASLEQNNLAQGTQRSELFNRAIEQLAHDSRSIRLGAIYTLIGLSNEYDELNYPVMQILSAHLRERPVGDDREMEVDREEIVRYLASRLTGAESDD